MEPILDVLSRFWFALEDATVANGCLWAVPGGHRLGLERRWHRAAEGFEFEELKERWTDLVTPFDSILAVGDAYRALGEHESAWLVFRATAEASAGSWET